MNKSSGEIVCSVRFEPESNNKAALLRLGFESFKDESPHIKRVHRLTNSHRLTYSHLIT